VHVSCHTCECIMSHTGMSNVTRMNESCHTYEWVMSHTWTSRATCVSAAWPIHICDTSPIHICDTSCHTCMCVTLFMYVWHDSIMSLSSVLKNDTKKNAKLKPTTAKKQPKIYVSTRCATCINFVIYVHMYMYIYILCELRSIHSNNTDTKKTAREPPNKTGFDSMSYICMY